jgi:hypothetical protein
MKALRWKRRQSHCVAPAQVAEHAAHMTTARTTAPAAPTVFSSAELADAGRQAIVACPESFEDLRGEGDQELVELAASDDENILKALATVGDLPADEAPYLGKFLAEQLFEDAMDAEYQQQLASYCAERHTVFTDEDADLAYEATDPSTPASWTASAPRRQRRTQKWGLAALAKLAGFLSGAALPSSARWTRGSWPWLLPGRRRPSRLQVLR